MDVKELRKQIDDRIIAYPNVAASESLDSLMSERDWFTGMLSYIGSVEAMAQFELVKSEDIYERKKTSTFLSARETKSDKTSYEIAKLEAAGEFLEFQMDKVKFDTIKRLRERTIKQIDTIAQRISVLRKEYDNNTFGN